MSDAALLREPEAGKNGHAGIALKDVETVEHDPTRVRKWVQLTRGVIGEIWD